MTVQKNVSGLELDADKTFVFHVYHFDDDGRLFEDCDVTVKGGKTTGQNTLVYVPYGTYYVEEDMHSAVISGYSVETTYDCESVEISEDNTSGLLIATNTYTPEQPDIPEGIWGGDIDFLKSEVETAATGIEGSATGTENVHTICLEVVPPEKKDVAIVMFMDTTSSMRNQCAACGVPKQYHPDQHTDEAGQFCDVTNWEGGTDHVLACDHFVERKEISEATAKAFIDSLGNLPNQNGKIYVRIVPFGAETVPDYTGWIDVTANGGVTTAQAAITNLPQKSGTNVSAAMRSAYEILSDDLPDGVTPDNTYVLLLTDGAPSVSDLANLPSDALSQSYIQSWLNKWSSYSHYEYVDDINDEVDAGYYIGAPYYVEKINGLSSHLYTVMLGTNLDWGSGYDNFENWRYVGGIGIKAHDHLKSFSDSSLYATSGTELTAYYNSILYALAPTLETISVTDPMSEYVDFLTFTDSNGGTKTIS
ncbi:MAG: VWA domain-containing protein, partial [Bacteroidia bacterium]|nr:VWA domain-containing protein [Bacteroidia bacterium]